MSDPNHTHNAVIDHVGQLPVEAQRRTAELNQNVSRAVARQRDTLVARLLNPDEARVVREHLVAELVQGFEYRRAELDLAMQGRLQAIREASNHVLMMSKAHLREQRIEHFSTAFQRLEARLHAMIDAYLAEAQARWERLEQIRVPHLREREEARQKQAAGDFLDTIDALLADFRRITDETIDLP